MNSKEQKEYLMKIIENLEMVKQYITTEQTYNAYSYLVGTINALYEQINNL